MFVFVIPILATRVKRKNAWASWKNYQKLYHLEENVHVFRELEVRFSLLWPKWVLQQQHIYLSGWKISLNKCLPLLLWIYLQELGEIILIILTSFSWFIFMRSFLKQRSIVGHRHQSDLGGNGDHLLLSGNIWANTSVSQLNQGGVEGGGAWSHPGFPFHLCGRGAIIGATRKRPRSSSFPLSAARRLQLYYHHKDIRCVSYCLTFNFYPQFTFEPPEGAWMTDVAINDVTPVWTRNLKCSLKSKIIELI